LPRVRHCERIAVIKKCLAFAGTADFLSKSPPACTERSRRIYPVGLLAMLPFVIPAQAGIHFPRHCEFAEGECGNLNNAITSCKLLGRVYTNGYGKEKEIQNPGKRQTIFSNRYPRHLLRR
jgi:hypothetical protein